MILAGAEQAPYSPARLWPHHENRRCQPGPGSLHVSGLSTTMAALLAPAAIDIAAMTINSRFG